MKRGQAQSLAWRIRSRRGATLLFCIVILPLHLTLLGVMLTRGEAANRQTRWEEERLRAELMAESAVAYASALMSNGDAGLKQGQLIRHQFDDRQHFEVESIRTSAGVEGISCRGIVRVTHAAVGPGMLTERIVVHVNRDSDGNGGVGLEIVERSREFEPEKP